MLLSTASPYPLTRVALSPARASKLLDAATLPISRRKTRQTGGSEQPCRGRCNAGLASRCVYSQLYNPPENYGSPLASPQSLGQLKRFQLEKRVESVQSPPRSRTLPGYYTGPAAGQGRPSIVGSVDWLYFRGRSIAGGRGCVY